MYVNCLAIWAQVVGVHFVSTHPPCIGASALLPSACETTLHRPASHTLHKEGCPAFPPFARRSLRSDTAVFTAVRPPGVTVQPVGRRLSPAGGVSRCGCALAAGFSCPPRPAALLASCLVLSLALVFLRSSSGDAFGSAFPLHECDCA